MRFRYLILTPLLLTVTACSTINTGASSAVDGCSPLYFTDTVAFRSPVCSGWQSR